MAWDPGQYLKFGGERLRPALDLLARIILDAPANVRLLDEANFLLYSQRKKHRYFGGYAPKRVIEIPAPHAGHWHLVVDLGGFAGTVRAWARVLQEAV